MADANDLILRAVEKLSDDTASGLAGINERLDRLNGRTRATESAVAVLSERTANMPCMDHAARFAVLEERVTSVKAPSSRSTIMTSGVVATVIALADGFWKWVSK